MIDWARLQNMCNEPTTDVPVLLAAAAEGSAHAWDGFWGHLVHQGTTCEAGVAALPALADLAGNDSAQAVALQAIELAGAITVSAIALNLMADDRSELLTALSQQADQRLSAKPDSYLLYFAAKAALDGLLALSETALDFDDTCFPVPCPACATEVDIVLGDYGQYSSIRDWDLGDDAPVPLRPADPEAMSGPQRDLYDIAVRDEQPRLAWGLRHLFGDAECGVCSAVFPIGEARERSWRQ
ncbi:hypothetical protein [Actinocorallia populi]|uniref:hypothetical protein n=1 Tax=Actinocorallia populi TaxID=2079200 RepID=UPI000D096369|nr:hypothetical protein [Actinocorallia populi]